MSISCKAVQYSDQKYCDRCGLCWDTNDPDPPKCRTSEEMKATRAAAAEELFGVKKGVLVMTTNRDVYKVTSVLAREVGRPKLKGRKMTEKGDFSRVVSEIAGGWEVVPEKRSNGANWIDSIRRNILHK